MSSVSLPLHWLNPLIVFSPYLSWNSLQTFSLLILYTPHFIRSDESSKPFDLNRFFRRKGSKLHPAPLIPWVKSPQASSEFSCSCGEDSQIQGKIILLNGHSLLSKNHLQPSMQHDQHVTDTVWKWEDNHLSTYASVSFSSYGKFEGSLGLGAMKFVNIWPFNSYHLLLLHEQVH